MASGEQLPEFRIVLDTNVAVSGLLSPQGASYAIVDLAVHHRGRLWLGASEENRDELPFYIGKPRPSGRGWIDVERKALTCLCVVLQCTA